jgi:hypothetical protein
MKQALLITVSTVFLSGCLIVSHTSLDSTAARTVYFLSTWFAYFAMGIGFIGGASLWVLNPFETTTRFAGTLLVALGMVGLLCFILGAILIKEI